MSVNKMGYQNNNRPKKSQIHELYFDVSFDLDDLYDDIKNDRLDKDKLLEVIEFIQETYKKFGQNKTIKKIVWKNK